MHTAFTPEGGSCTDDEACSLAGSCTASLTVCSSTLMGCFVLPWKREERNPSVSSRCGAVACCSLLLLTRALLMTPSPSKGGTCDCVAGFAGERCSRLDLRGHAAAAYTPARTANHSQVMAFSFQISPPFFVVVSFVALWVGVAPVSHMHTHTHTHTHTHAHAHALYILTTSSLGYDCKVINTWCGSLMEDANGVWYECTSVRVYGSVRGGGSCRSLGVVVVVRDVVVVGVVVVDPLWCTVTLRYCAARRWVVRVSDARTVCCASVLIRVVAPCVVYDYSYCTLNDRFKF